MTQPTNETKPTADGQISKAIAAYLRVCSSGGMPKELREQVQRSVDEAERLEYFEDTWRDGMQTACVMLISKRAKAEAEAVEAEARGYHDMALLLRMQARAASEVEQTLRLRMADDPTKWVMMPREPTEAMVKAAMDALNTPYYADMETAYAAMLAAAPSSSAEITDGNA